MLSNARSVPRVILDTNRGQAPRPATIHIGIKCGDELDLEGGEWVADFPDRSTHGYLISQLISSKVDPGEILDEYRRTRFPERFYNLKIGLAWADLQNRLDRGAILACCGDHGMQQSSRGPCTMGVDTGKELHVVISQAISEDQDTRQVVYIGSRQDYSALDELIERYNVETCVIDALPEIHATREFAARHQGDVWLNYFVETQRGSYSWDWNEQIVRENRTEALDASRRAIRERKVVLPRGGPVIQEFANHLASDVKRLVEDEDTGAQAYRYIRTAVNHYSLAFTYDCIAWSREVGRQPIVDFGPADDGVWIPML